jgi:uncharacterized protein (DUF488 family)
MVVDVRTHPYSRYAPQYSIENLRKTLADNHIQYHYLGNELGGRPDSPSLYDEKGYALYSKFVETEPFRRGIEHLIGLIQQGLTIALMCSEEEPNQCHRRLLITWYLYRELHIDALHIRGDGTTCRESDLQSDGSLSLFADDPTLSTPPRSAKPVRNHSR